MILPSTILVILFVTGCTPTELTTGLSLDSDTEPYPWNERIQYYFKSLASRMDNIVSEECQSAINHLEDGVVRLPNSSSTLNVASIPVDDQILRWWRSIQQPKQMRVDPNLCDAVMKKKRPIFTNKGCHLNGYMSASAPRCQNKYLQYICNHSRIAIDDPVRNGFVLPESNHYSTELPPQPWLMTASNSFVSMCGQISTDCGLVRTTANCMGTGSEKSAILFREKCPLSLTKDIQLNSSSIILPLDGTCNPGAPFSDLYEYHQKVFVVAEIDDTYVYHLHLEIMPRIIYHLDFLLANPDIKILIGCDTKKSPKATKSGLAHMLLSMTPLMQLAGLSMDRLVVHRHVFARDIYFPMEGGCQDPVYNTWQILTMRRHFLRALNISDTTSNSQSSGAVAASHRSSQRHGGEVDVKYKSELQSEHKSRPVMLLMKRSTKAKHTRNAEDSVRQWGTSFTNRLLEALKLQFPRYDLKLFSDTDEELMSCHACQVRAFAEADVLIGMHGAGLSNQLYMKPNSAVVELCPYPNDGRCLLGGGPFSRTSALLSHNYMIHHPPHEEYIWVRRDRTSEFDIQRFVNHISSFLQSVQSDL